jgi:hypothetical protein
MPRPRKDLNAFRDKIERRITSKHTHRQIRSWLAGESLIISKGILQSRCMARKQLVGRERQGRILRLSRQFHTIDHSDQTIADNITATGLPTTRNQIKRYVLIMAGGDEPIMTINWLR